MSQSGWRNWFSRTGSVEDAESNGSAEPQNGVQEQPTAEEQQAKAKSDVYQTLRKSIHNQLIDRVDMYRRLDPELAQKEVRETIETLLKESEITLPEDEQQCLIKEIDDDIFGLGPLEELMHDPMINDILVNNSSQIYVERAGQLEETTLRFRSDEHLLHVIDRIVTRVGRRVDEASPMVDARLPDGSRVHAIIPPLALDGPILSIRKFKKDPMTIDNLVQLGSLTPALGQFLENIVKGRLSILVSGGTGAGKTTLLNVLSGFVPAAERIVTIEDAAELRLQQRHVLRLETRPPNVEGRGQITQRDLVRNALRMRPDRIIVGEVRGPEALDMLQAMNTGHEGSITTIHANTPRDALSRLETMILLAGANLTQRAMRQQISSAIDLVVQIQRFSDGIRRVVSCSEIVGMEGETVTMQDLFLFKQTGIDSKGKIKGDFQFCGVRPMCAERLESMGLNPNLGI